MLPLRMINLSRFSGRWKSPDQAVRRCAIGAHNVRVRTIALCGFCDKQHALCGAAPRFASQKCSASILLLAQEAFNSGLLRCVQSTVFLRVHLCSFVVQPFLLFP